ncbi:hypothetical protein DRN67_03065 [Candidatus Micrarchaeota archaeon]|nr:MAG: hypothetical protein DRN67_03065 [Candidatus Micrarchaeota archaeon]
MASDLTRIAKGIVRALIGLAVGFLVGYEYYSFAPYSDDLFLISIGMGLVSTVVVFLTLSSMGKSSD